MPARKFSSLAFPSIKSLGKILEYQKRRSDPGHVQSMNDFISKNGIGKVLVAYGGMKISDNYVRILMFPFTQLLMIAEHQSNYSG